MNAVSSRPAADPRRQRLARLARAIGAHTLSGLLVLWVTATLAFFALHMMPGDAALSILGGGNPTPEAVADFLRQNDIAVPVEPEGVGADEPLTFSDVKGLTQEDIYALNRRVEWRRD